MKLHPESPSPYHRPPPVVVVVVRPDDASADGLRNTDPCRRRPLPRPPELPNDCEFRGGSGDPLEGRRDCGRGLHLLNLFTCKLFFELLYCKKTLYTIVMSKI